jgi:hypothetical protein
MASFGRFVLAWARRDERVRDRLAAADESRIEALAAMHRGFGDDRGLALVRAFARFARRLERAGHRVSHTQ